MTDERGGIEALLMGLIGMIIFGMTLPATRLAVSDFDPLAIVLARAGLAGLCGMLVLLLTRPPWPTRLQWQPLILYALFAVFAFPLSISFAMRYAPAAHGGVVLAITPLATALAGVLVARERPSMGFWLCGLAGSLAVVVFALLQPVSPTAVLGQPSALSSAARTLLANALLAGAIVTGALGYAYGGLLGRQMGGWQAICWAVILSLPAVIATFIALDVPFNWQAKASSWAGLIYVALGSQFSAFFFWNRGMALGGIARIGQIQLLQPFVTLAGAALLGERLTLLEMGFAAIVVAMVALGWRMRIARGA